MYGSRRAVTYDGITYAPGARFTVAVDGARLSGWQCDGPSAWRGWSQPLSRGDVLTCTGYGSGLGADPGYGVEFTSAASEAAGAFHCEVLPGVFSPVAYRPVPGVLAPEGK